MRLHSGGEALHLSDQIEGFASDRGQLKRSPTHPHDEVRLPMGVCQEALQNRRAGVAASAIRIY
jgi:hypothetical protein